MAGTRKKSYLYNLLWTRWNLIRARNPTEEEYRQVLERKFQNSNPRWLQSRSCLAQLVSIARTNGMRTIVIPFPVLRGIHEEHYPFRAYIQTVCSAAREAGAECLDVVPLLRRLDAPLRVSNVDPHPSAVVLKTVAMKLSEMW